ncbi:MAG: hypothetical protein WAW50_06240, partial [Trichococcus flocculiformis]
MLSSGEPTFERKLEQEPKTVGAARIIPYIEFLKYNSKKWYNNNKSLSNLRGKNLQEKKGCQVVKNWKSVAIAYG